MFEIQFHTLQSLKIKESELHKIYEETRALDSQSNLDEIKKLKRKMLRISEKVEHPYNVDSIR